jgi:hypothetical protein
MSNDSEVSHAARLRLLVGLAMERLGASRPAFYSEADFQHALAWEIQSLEPDAHVRLETPLLAGGKERLDVFVALSDGRYAIELKYPRARFRGTVQGEPVPFKRENPDAEDETRRAISEDIRRVERLVEEGAADAGCVVVLTNISVLCGANRCPSLRLVTWPTGFTTEPRWEAPWSGGQADDSPTPLCSRAPIHVGGPTTASFREPRDLESSATSFSRRKTK